MLKLDNNLLEELGLGSLPEDQKRSMLQHIYETLELRVGTNLANQMSDQQLEEFEKFIDDGGDANQAEALKWLETNLPNYKEVVNQVFEALKGEIKQMAPQLVASSAQQSAPSSPAPGAMPPQPMQPQYAPPAPEQSAYQQPIAPAGQGVGPQPYAAPVQAAQMPSPAAPQSVSDPFAQQAQSQPAADPYAPPQQVPMPPANPQPTPSTSPAGGYQPAPQGFQPPEPPNQQPPTGPGQQAA